MNIKFLKFGLFATLFAMTLFIAACGGSATENDDAETTEQIEEENDKQEHDNHNNHEHSEEGAANDKNGKEYTSAYVCIMHCEGSGSDAKGKCPVCGMDYVALADHEKDGHTH